MSQIHYNWQLKNAYKILNCWNKIASEKGENADDWDFVQKTKKEIRRYNKWLDEWEEEILYRHYDEDGWSYTELVQFPEWVETKDDAEEWFYNNAYMEYWPEDYDCTGQWFTQNYHIFKRNGRWMAYHQACKDV